MSPKQIFQRHFNNREAILNSRVGRWLGQHLHAQQLWHFGRRSVAGAVGIGLGLAFIPLPVHTVLAVVLAILFRVNLAVTVGAVWVANPLTVAPMFLFALKVGMWLTGDSHKLSDLRYAHSMAELGALFTQLWLPLCVGCAVCSIGAGVGGYTAVRWGWRAYLLRRWRRRHQPMLTARR